MIHTVKGFVIVNKVEVDVFLELSCCFDDPTDVGSLVSGSSAFSHNTDKKKKKKERKKRRKVIEQLGS